MCSNMKIAQQIPATSVTTIGTNGPASFFVITTHLNVQSYISFHAHIGEISYARTIHFGMR
jgi:hypothetical protein